MVSTEIKKIVLASQVLGDALKEDERIRFWATTPDNNFEISFTSAHIDDLVGIAKYYDTSIKVVIPEYSASSFEAYCMCGDTKCYAFVVESEVAELKEKCFETNVNFTDEREVIK